MSQDSESTTSHPGDPGIYEPHTAISGRAQELAPPRTLAQRLNACMADCRYLQKDSRTGIGDVKGIGHDAVAAAVGAAFVKHGVVIVPSVVHHEITELKPDTKGWAKGFLIDMKFRVVNADDSNDAIEASWSAIGPLNDKGLGIAESYATKRFLLKLMLLETGVNDESTFGRDNGNGGSQPPANRPPTQAVTDEQKLQFARTICAARNARLRDMGVTEFLPEQEWLATVVMQAIGITTVKIQAELSEISAALNAGRIDWVTGMRIPDQPPMTKNPGW